MRRKFKHIKLIVCLYWQKHFNPKYMNHNPISRVDNAVLRELLVLIKSPMASLTHHMDGYLSKEITINTEDLYLYYRFSTAANKITMIKRTTKGSFYYERQMSDKFINKLTDAFDLQYNTVRDTKMTKIDYMIINLINAK